MASSLERQQQALAASSSLSHDLSTIQTQNSNKYAISNPKDHAKKLNKKQFTQKQKMEKSYKRQRARAEDKAMRLKVQQNVGLHKSSKHPNHPHHGSHNNVGHGALPHTRSHPTGAGHSPQSSNHSSPLHSPHASSANNASPTHAGGNEHSTNSLTTNPNSPWVAYIDDHTKYTVYYNEKLGVSSWTAPDVKVGFRYIDVMAGEEPPEGAKDKVNAMDDPEGLGSDWMNTEYRGPSTKLAEDYRKRVLFRGGTMSVMCDLDELSSMGIGTLLYFKMIRHFIYTLCIMALITVPIIFSYSGSFQEVVGGATAVYVLTTRPLTAAPDCLRVQTEDSAAAFSALCQQALNQTVVNVLGLVVVDSATYSLMVSILDCCYTVYFIVSMITFFNLVKRYTMGMMARVGTSLCFGRSLVLLCGVFFGVLTHLFVFFLVSPRPPFITTVFIHGRARL